MQLAPEECDNVSLRSNSMISHRIAMAKTNKVYSELIWKAVNTTLVLSLWCYICATSYWHVFTEWQKVFCRIPIIVSFFHGLYLLLPWILCCSDFTCHDPYLLEYSIWDILTSHRKYAFLHLWCFWCLFERLISY